jgi:SAM-dependent methyltransferase
VSTDAERIVDIYERHADAWVDARLREGGLYEREWLDRFCALVPPGGSVLDIGCGAGEPIARYINERGYAVTGVDSSPAIAVRAVRRAVDLQMVRSSGPCPRRKLPFDLASATYPVGQNRSLDVLKI